MGNDLDLCNLKLVDHYISEPELVKRLCLSVSDNKINYNLFSNLLFKPVDYNEFDKYKGFYIATNVLREDLGFSKDDKPGDFDILIIPYSDNEVFFDRTCAIETKVVRPTRKKPKKSPNSNGVTQTKGLVRDGFPLVGLIHICMTEPLLEHEKSITKLDLTAFDMDNPHNNKKFLENTADVKVDIFSLFSAKNQMRRLITKEIPKYIGLCCIGVNQSTDGSLIIATNLEFNSRYEAGYFNPHLKQETVQRIEHFWNNNKKRFIHADK